MESADLDGLDQIARHHRQDEGFTPRLILCRARAVIECLPLGRILDLGCADGLLTAHVARTGRELVAVDASAIRLERARHALSGLPGVELRQAWFEDFEPHPGERFVGAILSCVLEHLGDPTALLRRVAGWLAPGGRVVAVVPNGASLHRRAGVHMGMLRDLRDHGETDHALGHDRVYLLPDLEAEFHKAGLRVVTTRGILLKPLPNALMVSLRSELVDAFERLGGDLPELAAEILVAGTPQEP